MNFEDLTELTKYLSTKDNKDFKPDHDEYKISININYKKNTYIRWFFPYDLIYFFKN